MAKVSAVEKNKRRRKTVALHAEKRALQMRLESLQQVFTKLPCVGGQAQFVSHCLVVLVKHIALYLILFVCWQCLSPFVCSPSQRMP